jgi:hypothetical protein
MGISGGPNIIESGLELIMDSYDQNSYTGGSTWKDLVSNSTFQSGNYSWGNDITQITIITFLEKTGNSTGYASNPISKWNTGTGNASFALYHFHNYLGNSPASEGVFRFYHTTSVNGWSGNNGSVQLSIGQKAHIVFQYNSVNGGQTWVNGSKVSSRSQSGTLGVAGTGGIVIAGPQDNGITKVYHASFYSRELSDNEIIFNYNSFKSRYGL